MIGEHAGIRNANKKQDLFDGKIRDVNAGNIIGIKTPNANPGKQNVPGNKDQSNNYVR